MKIGIVGCGQVGSTSAYACVLSGVGTELVLVDKDHALATAQAQDISHATPFAKAIKVSAGTYEALVQCGIVMIAAGVSQKPGENRLDLLKRNAAVLEDIIPQILKFASGAILLVATNPVDVITHMVTRIAEQSGHPAGRVIGSGTILDTARFRTLLAQHLNISSHSVHAYVLGEHGDSEVLNWSGASISNLSLVECARQSAMDIGPQVQARIDDAVRNAAYQIIKGKGATWYGIGAAMARIARAIIDDEHAVLTCTALQAQIGDIQNVTLSLPHVISAEGITRSLRPVLSNEEERALQQSAHIIKKAVTSVGF